MATATKLHKRNQRKKRIRSQVQGTATCPRLSVFRSNQSIYAQLINDEKGLTIASASSIKDKAGNVASATKVGETIAKLAKENKVTTCVFDRNGYKYHGRVKALAEAARAGGLQF